MMPLIAPDRWDVPALAAAWRAARPFPHVFLDGVAGGEGLSRLRGGAAAEPHWAEADEIHEFMASAQPPAHPALRDFSEALNAPALLRGVSEIAGKRVRRADLRSYVYLRGHHLLPHSDHRRDVGRSVAFAYYLGAPGEGGELELFACTVRDGEIVGTEPAALIEPREDRLVLFDVSDVSLHQVREVTRGARASLAGWFYP